ncbi:MAG: hypothetical protein GY719_22760 [bacterium]|nr:hypothetical protein [bacterium]
MVTENRDRERPTVSYLVRFWLEPREQESETSPLRGYVRDLHSGQEQYFGDPRKLAEHILRRLRVEQQQIQDETESIEDAVG